MAQPGPIMDGSFKKRQRTQIRTAAKAVQDAYLERIRDLRDDPLRVLPEVVGDEPAPIAKLRRRLEKIAAKGKGGFFDKRDKGVVGAVANILPVADTTSVPRIADHKVGGRRRFYLQRGQVSRGCSLGVQNHDDPEVLLWAYAAMAKAEKLHFFSVPALWVNSRPVPPDEWWVGLADRLDTALEQEAGDRWGDGHGDKDRLLLRFEGGAALAIRPKKRRNSHREIAGYYRGPRQRQPMEVLVLRGDGTEVEPDREVVAQYRGGMLDDQTLVKTTD